MITLISNLRSHVYLQVCFYVPLGSYPPLQYIYCRFIIPHLAHIAPKELVIGHIEQRIR